MMKMMFALLLSGAAALQLRPGASRVAARAGGRAPAAPEASRAAVDVAALSALGAVGFPLAACAEVPGWVAPVSSALDPFLFFIQFIMLLRVIISWYPETDVNAMPWRIVTWPTEPILSVTRAVVPPSFGVDISPIVWIALASFSRELLLGQQGVLILMMQKG